MKMKIDPKSVAAKVLGRGPLTGSGRFRRYLLPGCLVLAAVVVVLVLVVLGVRGNRRRAKQYEQCGAVTCRIVTATGTLQPPNSMMSARALGPSRPLKRITTARSRRARSWRGSTP